MNTWRLCLLLCLTLLVPFRGAVGSVLPCALHGGAMTAAVQAPHPAEPAAADPTHCQTDSAAPASACTACAVFCGGALPLLPTAAVWVGQPPAGAALVATAVGWPASFVSDGQDRPPRTV